MKKNKKAVLEKRRRLLAAGVPTLRKQHTPKNEEVWVIKKVQGYTNKVLQEWEYPTEVEAMRAWEKFLQANKFAGAGGRYTPSYSFPERRSCGEKKNR